MKNLLNKFAWLLSFAVSFWFFSSIFWWEDIEATIILWIIFWLIIKWIFLSENEIYNSLEIFYKNILKNLEKEKSFTSKTEEKTKEVISEKIISEKVEALPEIQKTFNDENDFLVWQKSQSEKSDFVIWKTSVSDKKISETKEQKNETQVVSALKWEFLKTEVWNNLANFFKENILAKIWAVFVLIWVAFLMIIIWNEIPDLLKLVLGFLIWFSIYFVWIWLDKKKFIWESRILMWMWIWINYLVILAWRYILDYGLTNDESFSIILTFWALILNTIFWIYTALNYKNKNLLIFSFIIAYINPLLLGSSSDEPYTLLIYTLIITISAIFIWEKVQSRSLIILSFLAWNFFFLVAPASGEIWFLTKLTFSFILSFIFANIKTIKNLEIENGSLLTNSIIFSPIILQAIFKNTEISDFSYIAWIIYSTIIFWYFIYKIQKENSTYFLPIANSLVIILFIALNAGANEISIHTFTVSIVLALVNIFLPFYIKNLKENSSLWAYSSSLVSSSIFSLVSSILFLIIKFENNFENDLMILKAIWNIFLIYSSIYLIFWWILTKVFSISSYKESKFKNLFILFFSIFLSFFTIWVGLVVGEENSKNLVLPTIWLVESMLLMIIFKLTSDFKFKIFSNIVSTIWLLLLLINIVENYWIYYEIFFPIIFWIIIWKIFLQREKIWVYDYFLHIFGIFVFTVWLDKIFGTENILHNIILITFLWFFYKFLEDKFLKKFFVFVFAFYSLSQIWAYSMTHNLFIAIFWIISFFLIALHYQKSRDENMVKINTIYYLFLFIFSSIILVDLTEEHLILGIYWWIVWACLIVAWLKFEKILIRTIGLYLLTLTIWKAILFDIWVTNPLLFFVIWPILIAISVIYTKYVWNDISKEYSLENIFWKKENLDLTKEENLEKEEKYIIEKILETDISEIKSVSFIIDEKEFLKTKFRKIIQIMKFIENEKWKNIFEKQELLEFYKNISEKYPQRLSDKERKKAEEVLKYFAEKWWKIIFK